MSNISSGTAFGEAVDALQKLSREEALFALYQRIALDAEVMLFFVRCKDSHGTVTINHE
jgi:hypothetical protein